MYKIFEAIYKARLLSQFLPLFYLPNLFTLFLLFYHVPEKQISRYLIVTNTIFQEISSTRFVHIATDFRNWRTVDRSIDRSRDTSRRRSLQKSESFIQLFLLLIRAISRCNLFLYYVIRNCGKIIKLQSRKFVERDLLSNDFYNGKKL